MSNSVILVGGNLVSDTDFRKKLAGRDAGVELQMVVEDLLSRFDCLKYLSKHFLYNLIKVGIQRAAQPMTMSLSWLRKQT